MSELSPNVKDNKVAAAKTVVAPEQSTQGKYRWSFEYKDGRTASKYLDESTKNVYASREGVAAKVQVPLRDVAAAALTDEAGKIAAVIEVPEDAVVWQRRRVVPINYNSRFYDYTETVPATRTAGGMTPEHKVTRKLPEVTYDQVWLIGYRRREADGVVSIRFKAVYPDGKVDEHTAFNSKAWLYEPEWFSEEQV